MITWNMTKALLDCLAGAAVLAGIAAWPTAAASVTLPAPAILNPGQSVSLPDFPAPSSVLATQTETFGSASGPGPEGTLTEYVVNNAQYSPYRSADLVFAFQLQITRDNVAQISLPGFSGFDTAVKICNVADCAKGTGIAPTSAERSANGNIVSFLWNTAMTGQSSTFSIYTNATDYTDPPMIQIFDLAGNFSVAPTFLPTATPLPSTWVMLLTGLAGLGLLAYHRKKSTVAVFAAA
jgi:hypothetical protein